MEQLYPTGPVTHLFRQLSHLQRFRKDKQDRFDTLTGREVEVLALIAGGLENPAIAEELGITRVTVQNHRSRIREKLHIENQTGYVTYALAYDLIQL